MIASLKKNALGILLMSMSALLVCFGQLMWKLSHGENLLFLGSGFVLYGIGAIVMIIAYRFGKLSVLQPVLSLNYVVSIIIAKFLLNEEVSVFKLLSIILIILGVVIIGGGDD